MPVQINVLDDGEGIEFISSGIVTGEEVIEANKKVYTREDPLRMKYKIVDRTGCTEYRVSSKDVQILADQVRMAAKINPNFLIAVVSATDLQYGVTRMWQAYIDDLDIKTMAFRDRKSAEEWIQEELKQTVHGT